MIVLFCILISEDLIAYYIYCYVDINGTGTKFLLVECWSHKLLFIHKWNLSSNIIMCVVHYLSDLFRLVCISCSSAVEVSYYGMFLLP